MYQSQTTAAQIGGKVMRVLSSAVYRGPHLHSNTPMVRIELDLGVLEHWPTNRLVGFSERLLSLLPGLRQHGCCYGEAGGLLRRLEEGTWLGHVAEHVALELQCLVGMEVQRGKTRSVRGRPGVYDVMFAYREEAVGRLAGRLALELVASILPPDLSGIEGLDRICDRDHAGFDVHRDLEQLRQLARSVGFGPTTGSLVREAERRGIPWQRVDGSSFVILGQGCRQTRIWASTTSRTSHIAAELASDKDLTRLMLARAGLPVPDGRLVRDMEAAVAAAEELAYPVVTKPLDGNHGRGVSIDLRTPAEVRWGFEQARQHSSTVIVERYVAGADHRILVVDGKVVAVAERVPAAVVGDGISPIEDLVRIVNEDPRRGEGHEAFMTRISIDDCVRHFLASSGLTPESVPAPGQTVFLRPTANLSTGGTAIDRTDAIHPENAALAVQAAAVIGLDIAGIDFVSPDIARPVSGTGGAIIEVNAGPGFRMHLQPSVGRPRNVARPVLDMLYPTGSTARIPVFAITGTNGKSTTARMLSEILQASGRTVGLTSTTGIYVNGRRIVEADASGPKSARTVLADPKVEAAVLETARGGILREGLGFDRCDVGAVLNIAPDHLGLKGIETLDDLAAVKSVVVEAVARNGCSVLNADDPLTAAMAERAGGRICYFSMQPEEQRPAFLRTHIERGGLAVVRDGSGESAELNIWEDGETLYLMPAGDIPATFSGHAEFNVANALAAAAMAHAGGVPLQTIATALRGFTSSFEKSPGRLNAIDVHGYRVILDYAHNPHGLEALGDLVEKLRPGYRRTIGVIGIPGDRRDEDIRRMGALATQFFDQLVLKEDDELRGRDPGTVAALMREGAIAAGCRAARIHTVLSETGAVELCLQLARAGDLVVVTADHIEEVWHQLKRAAATPEPPRLDTKRLRVS